MCKSSNDNVAKVDLETEPFEEISITVNEKEKIRLDEKKEKWLPSIIASKVHLINTHVNQDEDNDNTEKIERLKEDIENRDQKINELKSKIKEINEKLDTMKKVLNVDVREQEYVKDLEDKINKENAIAEA